MKTKAKLIALIGAVALLAAGGAGAAVWWMQSHRAQPPADGKTEAPKEVKPAPDYKYVTLDKVLVMLRGPNGSAVSHYMAVDIVFKTLPEQEKRTKEHLPLLRTVAVKALSVHTVESASAMSVEEFAQLLNKAYQANYAAERREPPFAEALIGKLIIE
ncbi:flagellar basal body protein [Roseateles sp. SL47]|uniref:flagellar basal body-associated FliL family protein n=1 Tax=Roseateles sp. SL47 TaxID=2995138 RepID=UPI002271531D|nr:flagellar basal body-associated FliL family protein [Roseateles sp. SL47]WAC75543.1 flagellar basal body protein [Roseateles sp. SL47]